MHDITYTWQRCCEGAIDTLEKMGWKKFGHWRTISNWNEKFRYLQTFKFNKKQKVYSPMLLELYPEAKNSICNWISENRSALSCESLAVFMRQDLAEEMYKNFKNDCRYQRLTLNQFKHMLNLSRFSVSTLCHYLDHFGYKYCDRKKSYYNYKHECEENIADKLIFIKNYQKHEIDTYRWIQVTEEEAIRLENEEGLLPGVAAYCYDGMREYHVDCHPSFLGKNPGLSVRRDPNSRPKRIYGQDETVVNQFIFSENCWHDIDGATELLPKSDGFAKMISGICSRDDGLGVKLTEQQLHEINERRTNGIWSEYVSTDSALEIYGTTKKKKLTSKHALIQYFDLGMHNEGYWTYDHIALQMEDAFDVLSIVFPHCDFVFLLDQSSGHGKRRKGGLDAKNMNLHWGGKKEKMRETVVTENGPHRATHLAGELQCMQFIETDQGPFYLTPEQRIERKYPRETGEIKRRDKTITELLEELRLRGFRMKGRCIKEELDKIATEHNIPLQIEERVTLPGWVGGNKGILQVLWERGFVDEKEYKQNKKSLC